MLVDPLRLELLKDDAWAGFIAGGTGFSDSLECPVVNPRRAHPT
jgi:hypothetical protein